MRVAPAFLLLTSCAARDLERTIERYGFAPIQPPSTLLAPGSIVVADAEDPDQVGLLCTTESAIGDVDRTVRSATTDVVRTMSRTRSFRLSPKTLAAVTASAGVKHVRDVQLSFRNATQIELPRDAAMAALALHRSSDCGTAVAWYADRCRW